MKAIVISWVLIVVFFATISNVNAQKSSQKVEVTRDGKYHKKGSSCLMTERATTEMTLYEARKKNTACSICFKVKDKTSNTKIRTTTKTRTTNTRTDNKVKTTNTKSRNNPVKTDTKSKSTNNTAVKIEPKVKTSDTKVQTETKTVKTESKPKMETRTVKTETKTVKTESKPKTTTKRK